MRHTTIAVLLIIASACVREIAMNTEVQQQLGANFMKAMDDCKSELTITNSVLMDFYRIWRQQYDQVSREAGCVLHCMSSKVELFTVKLRKGNTKEFAMNNGADEAAASDLHAFLKECESKHGSDPDECTRALNMSRCVRDSMEKVQWKPNMEVVLDEIIAEA